MMFVCFPESWFEDDDYLTVIGWLSVDANNDMMCLTDSKITAYRYKDKFEKLYSEAYIICECEVEEDSIIEEINSHIFTTNRVHLINI